MRTLRPNRGWEAVAAQVRTESGATGGLLLDERFGTSEQAHLAHPHKKMPISNLRVTSHGAQDIGISGDAVAFSEVYELISTSRLKQYRTGTWNGKNETNRHDNAQVARVNAFSVSDAKYHEFGSGGLPRAPSSEQAVVGVLGRQHALPRTWCSEERPARPTNRRTQATAGERPSSQM